MDHRHASLKSHKRQSKNRIDIRNLDFFHKIKSKSIVFGNFKIVHYYLLVGWCLMALSAQKAISCHVKIKSLLKILISDRKLKSSGYAGMNLSETQKLSTRPTFPLFGMSSPREETHCSAMWWDSPAHCGRRLAAARTGHRFGPGWQQQPGREHPSAFVLNGSSSWPLRVDATDLCCLRDLMMMMMMYQAPVRWHFC